MPESNLGRNAVITAGLAAAAAVGVYMLRRHAQKSDSRSFTQEEMEQFLTKIIDSQKQMKKVMEDLASEISHNNLDFANICTRVAAMSFPDPLAEHGLTIDKFSQMLSYYNGNPEIRSKILQLTSGSDGSSPVDPKVLADLTNKFGVEDIIEIHRFMLSSLRAVMEEVSIFLNPRVATVAVQAYIGRLVKSKYNVSGDELEALASYYHATLAEDDRFFEIGSEMREAVQSLVLKCSQK